MCQGERGKRRRLQCAGQCSGWRGLQDGWKPVDRNVCKAWGNGRRQLACCMGKNLRSISASLLLPSPGRTPPSRILPVPFHKAQGSTHPCRNHMSHRVYRFHRIAAHTPRLYYVVHTVVVAAEMHRPSQRELGTRLAKQSARRLCCVCVYVRKCVWHVLHKVESG